MARNALDRIKGVEKPSTVGSGTVAQQPKPIQGLVPPPATKPIAPVTSVAHATEHRPSPLASHPPRNFEEMAKQLAEMQGLRPNTPEEQAKYEKRKKSRALISSIGDVISNMANIYFAHKGAPPVPQTSLTGKLKEHYDRLDAIRREKLARYGDLVQRGKLQDLEHGRYNMQAAYQREKEARANALAMAKLKQEADKLEHQAERLRQQGKLAESQIALNKARQKREETRSEYEPQLIRSQIGRNNALTNASYKRGGGSSNKVKKVQSFPYGDTSIDIDDRLVKAVMSQAANLMIDDRVIKPYEIVDKSPSYVQELVRQKWQQSPKATELMLKMSTSNADGADDDNKIVWDDDDSNEDSIQWD